MTAIQLNGRVSKLETGIPGFDLISHGGLPEYRTTLLSGTAGSAKTVFAVQFLAEGIIHYNQGGVFVTFEESPEDIRRNVKDFGWDIEAWEQAGKWVFVDASPQPSVETREVGQYDLGALVVRIERAVQAVQAKRVSLDSLGAIFSQFANTTIIRSELFRIASALKKMDVTSVMTAERTSEYGEIGRFGIEEFVADNVLVLRNVLDDEKRRRTMEILKLRGTSHQNGEFPFTIHPKMGIVGLPLSAIELKQRSSNVRVSSGNIELDTMCGGGFFRDSVTLVSGATGTGKTLTVTTFINGGNMQNERSMLFAFEESREQLFRNASGWGMDLESMEQEGKLKVVCQYPEIKGLEEHLLEMKQAIEAFKPNRVAIDSFSALERVATQRSFREFVISLTSFIKEKEITGLFTSTSESLLGGTSITEAHISTLTDSIILLRYVETYGEMRRGMTVLKMRGSMHDKDIRELKIDGKGMHIGRPFRNINGILSGTPTFISSQELERLERLFQEEPSTTL